MNNEPPDFPPISPTSNPLLSEAQSIAINQFFDQFIRDPTEVTDGRLELQGLALETDGRENIRRIASGSNITLEDLDSIGT
jgi:hypothetical protein